MAHKETKAVTTTEVEYIEKEMNKKREIEIKREREGKERRLLGEDNNRYLLMRDVAITDPQSSFPVLSCDGLLTWLFMNPEQEAVEQAFL